MSTSVLLAGEPLPARTRNHLWVLAVLNSLLVSFTWPLTALLSERLGVTGAAQGFLFAVGSLGYMASATWAAPMSDRRGKRSVIASHLAVTALAWLIAAAHLSYLSAAMALFMTGAGSASLTAVSAYFGAHTEASTRSRTFAGLLALRGLGQTAGPLVLLVVLPSGLVIACIALAVAAGLLALASLLLQDSRPGPGPARIEQAGAPRRLGFGLPVATVPLLVAMGLLWTSPGSVSNYVPLHAKEGFGAGDAGLAMLFSVLGLTMVVAPGVLWLFGRWFREPVAARLAFWLTCLSMLGVTLAQGPFVLVSCFVLWGLMWDVTYPYVKAELSRRARAEQQAAVMGAEQFVTGALMTLGATVAGAAYAGFGAASVFAGATVLGVLGLVVFWRATRQVA